ncbi:PREDICTED: small subunit processome component 20 homolog, partial [Priapulus caudatus]|uniref:Small subunit processome component 20 homolog n=1 Tax=Priapulus caudatus TaxID=37621 RepID=A0ABM1EPE9_PRICU
FQSFSEQLSKVSIDVVHRIGNREELPEDSDTFFYETLVKWADLNCTEHFVTLWHELKSKVQSFALLVHHKEEVVAALKRHLLVPDTMALDALTELVVALARDMQADFYVYFRDFFDIIVSLLSTGLPDRLEQCFTCLAYLFKFLWRYLSNDIEDIFRIYSPLLSGKQKPHIRRFAAESFAFLMRKVKNPGHLFDTVFNILALHPEYVPGIGHLLFEVIKGIKDQFHSCTSAVLPLLLAKLGPCSTHAPTTSSVGTDEPSYNIILDAQLEMMGLITNHATKEFIGVIWEVLFASVVGLRESIRVQKPVPLDTGDVRRQQLLEQHLERVLTMMLSIVEYKRGILVVPTERLCSELCLLLEPDEPATCGSTVLHIASRLLLADRCAQLTPQQVSRICKAVYRCAHTREQVLDFSRDMFPYKMFEKDVLPQLVDYCQIQLQQESGAIGSVLQLMVELVLFKRPLLEDASKLADYKIYPLPFPNQKSAKDNFGVQLLSALEKVCESDDYTPSDFSHAWAALVLLPHMRYMDSERVVAEVRRFIAALLTRDLIDREVAVLAQAYVVLSQLLEHRDAASAITLDTVLSLLKKDAENLAALRVADLFFTLADACGEEAFLGEDTADKLFPLLVNNLSSPYHQV